MKSIYLCAACCLWLVTCAVAQDGDQAKTTEPKDWIKKFDGSWTTISRSPDGATKYDGSMTSRLLGEHWVVNEFRMDMDGFKFHALQTLGFDAEREVFTATWVDNALDFKWVYEGKLDADKRQLVFVAEGPDMSGGGGTSRYRDIYEFRDDDLIVTTSQSFGDDGNWKTFMSAEMTREMENKEFLRPRIAPLLMFEGDAEKAMQLYVSIFPDSMVDEVTKYGEGETGQAGSIKHASFRVAGTRLMCIDSPADHPFDFSPSVSLYVDCDSQQQIESIFEKLSQEGKVLMPLADYEFSNQFGWVTDRFGVSWQLNFGALK